MPILAACCVVIDKESRVLLTQREDFEVWCLPGGEVDDGESLAQAAAREVREETGIEVELQRLIGVYSRPQWRSGAHVTCFAGHPVGGQLQGQSGEVIDLAFFAPEKIPSDLFVGHAQCISDALAGLQGTAYHLGTTWPFAPDLPRQKLYALRDESGLSRRDFYFEHLANSNAENDYREVAGTCP